MDNGIEFFSETLTSQEKATELMEKLIAVGRADSAFSQPVESGEYKVITAASVSVGMGYGYGGGAGGNGPAKDAKPDDSDAPSATTGVGFGGGGGGASTSRPVAAIEIGPEGVRVEPIVDVTKIGLALFTTLISMFTLLGKARRLK